MTCYKKIAFLLIFLVTPGILYSLCLYQPVDTAAINSQTREAYLNARVNPDLSLVMSYQALSSSKVINYEKGMADAFLALGMAHLAKFNQDDSAYYYNMEALNLYQKLNSIQGKALACYALSYVFSFKSDLKESERYGTLSLNYFEQSGNSRGMINAYSVLSYLARQKNDLNEARAIIEQAIEVARSVNDTIPLADALNSLGNIYKEMALFNQAIESYFGALSLWEAIEDIKGLSIAYGSIGAVYFFQKDYDRALEYYLKNLSISEDAGDMWETSKTMNNISQVYNVKAEYDSSLLYARKSLRINEQMNLQTGVANALYNMATIMLGMAETDSAFIYINRAVDIAREITDPGLMNYLVTLGHTYRIKKEYDNALKYAREAYAIAKEQNLPLDISDAAALLNDIYSQMGRNDLAYGYMKEFYQIQDSINSDEFHKRITRLDIQYEFDKKEKDAELARVEERILHENRLKQQRLYLKGLVVLIFLLGVISILYIRHNRVQARYRQSDLEQRLLRAQMNPHFIFNSLCAVQELINEGKPGKANIFLAKIARLMRNILENSSEEYIPLEKEIETLRLYMDVQKLRFEPGFEYSIEISDKIDPGNFAIPPMLAQPCVENSIEHGLKSSGGKGRLSLSYELNNGIMIMEIEDNGIGREAAATRSSGVMQKESISTHLTRKRLEYFRKVLGDRHISLQITDLYDGKRASGTRVVMYLPYRKIFT